MIKFAQQCKTKTLLFILTCSFSTITITLSIVNTKYVRHNFVNKTMRSAPRGFTTKTRPKSFPDNLQLTGLHKDVPKERISSKFIDNFNLLGCLEILELNLKILFTNFQKFSLSILSISYRSICPVVPVISQTLPLSKVTVLDCNYI